MQEDLLGGCCWKNPEGQSAKSWREDINEKNYKRAGKLGFVEEERSKFEARSQGRSCSDTIIRIRKQRALERQ